MVSYICMNDISCGICIDLCVCLGDMCVYICASVSLPLLSCSSYASVNMCVLICKCGYVWVCLHSRSKLRR